MKTTKWSLKEKQENRSLDAFSKGKKIIIVPGRARKFLLYIVLFLLAGYIVTGLLNKILHIDNVFTHVFYYLFDLDGENNIPSAFSFLLLLITSALLTFTSSMTRIKKNKKFWSTLSFVFLFLALDELIQIHEHLSEYLKRSGTTVVASSDYVWVLPYAIFAILIGLFFLKFVLRLPQATKSLFFLSGLIYVGSALGIDYIQGIIEKQKLNHFYYKVLTLIEEPGEMIGVIIFIYALLGYIFFENGATHITLDSDEPSNQKIITENC
jgi:hypothetical protein